MMKLKREKAVQVLISSGTQACWLVGVYRETSPVVAPIVGGSGMEGTPVGVPSSRRNSATVGGEGAVRRRARRRNKTLKGTVDALLMVGGNPMHNRF